MPLSLKSLSSCAFGSFSVPLWVYLGLSPKLCVAIHFQTEGAALSLKCGHWVLVSSDKNGLRRSKTVTGSDIGLPVTVTIVLASTSRVTGAHNGRFYVLRELLWAVTP